MKKLFVFSLLVFSGECFGQSVKFQKVFGGSQQDIAFSAVQLPDDDYAVAGWTESFGAGSADIFLLRTDKFANLVWMKRYGGTQDDYFSSFSPTTDGGFIICGNTLSFGLSVNHAYLIKTDSSGNIQWSKVYEPDSIANAGKVIETTDGGFAFTGSTMNSVSGNYELWLVKTDATGVIQFSKTFSDTVDISGNGIIQTPDSGYIIGSTRGTNITFSKSILLSRTDKYGNLLWTKKYDTNYDDYFSSMVPSSDGGLIIANHLYTYGGQLLKVNAAGDTLWTRVGFFEYGTYISPCGNSCPDDFLICGTLSTSFGLGNPDGMIARIDSSANIVWQRVYYSTAGNLAIESIVPTSDSGILAVGLSADRLSPSSSNDIIAIKTDSLGYSGCYYSSYPFGGNMQLLTSVTSILLIPTVQNINSSPVSTTVTSGTSQSVLCLSIGIDELETVPSPIQISPNPSNGLFKIEGLGEMQEGVIEIYNVLGEQVFSSVIGRQSSFIDLRSQPKGIYFYRVTSGSEVIGTGKLVIE